MHWVFVDGTTDIVARISSVQHFTLAAIFVVLRPMFKDLPIDTVCNKRLIRAFGVVVTRSHEPDASQPTATCTCPLLQATE